MSPPAAISGPDGAFKAHPEQKRWLLVPFVGPSRRESRARLLEHGIRGRGWSGPSIIVSCGIARGRRSFPGAGGAETLTFGWGITQHNEWPTMYDCLSSAAASQPSL